MWAIADDFEVAAQAPTSHPAHYPQGTLVRVQVSFTQSGNFADPDGVNLRFRPPRQHRTTWIYGIDAAIVKDSTGVYHADLDTTSAVGIWRYRWDGGAAMVFGQFTVGRDHPARS